MNDETPEQAEHWDRMMDDVGRQKDGPSAPSLTERELVGLARDNAGLPMTAEQMGGIGRMNGAAMAPEDHEADGALPMPRSFAVGDSAILQGVPMKVTAINQGRGRITLTADPGHSIIVADTNPIQSVTRAVRTSSR